MNIRGVDVDRARDREALHLSMEATQTAFNRFGGSVEKILVDDKGAVIVGVFGVPPHSHHDDPTRAIRAAMELERSLRGLRIEYGIGVTTGFGFCGAYGSEVHREFSISAGRQHRLSADGGVNQRNLCDSTTRDGQVWTGSFSDLGLANWPADPAGLVHSPLWEGNCRRALTSLRAHLCPSSIGS